ncbi:MAG: hypothetical protein NHF90_00050 [Candidatus Shikimatogenerans sp. JK-2022]|nr:hypothetical protein [Candidatus Shikimatogenerans bostrichidophilus]
MKKKQYEKILKIRKLTNYSLILCKKALIKEQWNIKKAIKYLIKKEGKKKINKDKLKYGLVYSEVNKTQTIGHIIVLKVKSEEVSNNYIILKILKKILKISLLNKCKNINEIYKSRINKDKNIEKVLLDKNIMFKDSIIIYKFLKLKSDYIFNYNHYNYKLSSLIGFKIKKINKIILKILKYISLDIIGNYLLKEKNLVKLNNYYNSETIDPTLLKRINLDIKEYLYYIKYIKITDYYITNI